MQTPDNRQYAAYPRLSARVRDIKKRTTGKLRQIQLAAV